MSLPLRDVLVKKGQPSVSIVIGKTQDFFAYIFFLLITRNLSLYILGLPSLFDLVRQAIYEYSIESILSHMAYSYG